MAPGFQAPRGVIAAIDYKGGNALQQRAVSPSPALRSPDERRRRAYRLSAAGKPAMSLITKASRLAHQAWHRPPALFYATPSAARLRHLHEARLIVPYNLMPLADGDEARERLCPDIRRGDDYFIFGAL